MSVDHAVGWAPAAALLVAPVALYSAGVVVRRRRTGRAWSGWRTASVVAGCVLLAVAVAPPTEQWGHDDLRGHMVQHLLLGMVAPLALVLAAPATLLLGAGPLSLRRAMAVALRSRVVHVLVHPVTAAVVSLGGLYLLYLTPLYAVSRHDTTVHHLVHVHLVLAGYLVAWSLAGPDPARGRPGVATRLVVLVVAGGAHAVLAKLLYSRAPALPPDAGVGVLEVQDAARWMYYGGDVVEVLLAGAVLAWWYRQRVRADRRCAQPVTSGPALVGVTRSTHRRSRRIASRYSSQSSCSPAARR